MYYRAVEYWTNFGLITNDMTPELKIELAKNLKFAKDVVFSNKVLSDDFDFYEEVENMLYPIIVHYTKFKGGIWQNGLSIVHKFIEFCNDYLRVKYDINRYNDDYLLCKEFMNLNLKADYQI